MNKPYGLVRKFFFHEPTVYLIFCIGIVYSMFFWPLLNSICCISLGVYWLIFSRKSFRFKSKEFRLVVLFISLYLISVIGMFYTVNLQKGFFWLQLQSALLLFPLVMGCSTVMNPKMVRTILTHFILANLLAALLGLVHGLVEYHPAAVNGFDEGYAFLFPHSYPFIMGLNCLMSLVLIAEKKYDSIFDRRWLIILSVLFLSVYLLLLNVRLISACWLLILIYYIFRFIPGRSYRFLISLIVISLACIAFFKIPLFRDKWDELKNYNGQGVILLDKDASLGRSWGGASIRMALWKCSEDLILRHPLTGVGTGDIQDSLQQAYEQRKFYFASRYNSYNIHNQYLNMLLGFGVGGLAVLLACMIVPALILKGDTFVRVRLVFLLLFFLICFTEVILDINKGIIWYSFFNSIFAFGAGQKEVKSYPAA
jgi:O-antigen ligase